MSAALDELLAVMARLRDPEHGCDWDRAQDFSTIAPYTIEEAYEVADAIDRGDFDDLRGELGDLLFQVVFHARMAEEAGHFVFEDVARAIVDKLKSRHPHVFGTAAEAPDWEALKAAERARQGEADPSALAGIARGLPEWQRALKFQQRAARAGFEWPDTAAMADKVDEELEEVRAELTAGDPARLEHEIGDLLFAAVNLARGAGVDPSAALRAANARFEQRFRRMEALSAAEGTPFNTQSLSAMLVLWQQAKDMEAG